MPTEGSINIGIKNNIGTIEFYHPKGNSLPGSLLKELSQGITELGENSEVGVIVLRSKGEGAFCAGASFDELIAIENKEEGKKFFLGFSHVLNAMRKSSKLVIVRVQGKTVGGGVGLAAGGDYTIAHESADVKLSELALGIGPFVVGPAVKRKIGVAAFGVLATDAKNWHSADWAHKCGLFSKVCDSRAELDKATANLAHDLANSSPAAMQELKRMFWQGTENWEELMQKRAETSGKLVLSDFSRNFIEEFKKK